MPCTTLPIEAQSRLVVDNASLGGSVSVTTNKLKFSSDREKHFLGSMQARHKTPHSCITQLAQFHPRPGQMSPNLSSCGPSGVAFWLRMRIRIVHPRSASSCSWNSCIFFSKISASFCIKCSHSSSVQGCILNEPVWRKMPPGLGPSKSLGSRSCMQLDGSGWGYSARTKEWPKMVPRFNQYFHCNFTQPLQKTQAKLVERNVCCTVCCCSLTIKTIYVSVAKHVYTDGELYKSCHKTIVASGNFTTGPLTTQIVLPWWSFGYSIQWSRANAGEARCGFSCSLSSQSILQTRVGRKVSCTYKHSAHGFIKYPNDRNSCCPILLKKAANGPMCHASLSNSNIGFPCSMLHSICTFFFMSWANCASHAVLDYSFSHIFGLSFRK